mmetsp:Transcript_67251/g.158631  ORF Transcript_67251/g.158631 Transcript_67251/m.158631 type:complete len:219 (+) Transcript_67251:556-1212(+)
MAMVRCSPSLFPSDSATPMGIESDETPTGIDVSWLEGVDSVATLSSRVGVAKRRSCLDVCRLTGWLSWTCASPNNLPLALSRGSAWPGARSGGGMPRVLSQYLRRELIRTASHRASSSLAASLSSSISASPVAIASAFRWSIHSSPMRARIAAHRSSSRSSSCCILWAAAVLSRQRFSTISRWAVSKLESLRVSRDSSDAKYCRKTAMTMFRIITETR